MQLVEPKAVLSVLEVKRSNDDGSKGSQPLQEQLALLEWAICRLRPQDDEFSKAGNNFKLQRTIHAGQGSATKGDMMPRAPLGGQR
jgi:hypothetical protein